MKVMKKFSDKKVSKSLTKMSISTCGLYTRFILLSTSCPQLAEKLMEPLQDKVTELLADYQFKKAQQKLPLLSLLMLVSRNIIYQWPEIERSSLFQNCLFQCLKFYTEQASLYKKNLEKLNLKPNGDLRNSMAENNKCCADIVLSIVKEYVRLQIEGQEEALFDLLKYQYFYQDLMGQIKRAILVEEGSVNQLLDVILRIYFYPKQEPQQILMNENEVQFQSNQNFNMRTLTYLFSILTDWIDLNSPNVAPVQKVVSMLYQKVVLESSIYLIKFAKSLTVESIQQVKKIFIYLRENEELKEAARQWKDMMVVTLQCSCNPVIIIEYFSFLREIFYYNQDMDPVDYQLTIDMLDSYNQLLQAYKYVKKEKEQNLFVSDYYFFSNLNKGLLLMDNFRLKESFAVACLFKINSHQLKELFQLQNLQEDQLITMAMFGFFGRDHEENKNNFIPISANQTYFKFYEYELHKDQWHLLVVKFKMVSSGGLFGNHIKYKVMVFVDDLKNALTEMSMTFSKNMDYTLYQGCQMTQISSQNLQCDYVFQGQMSLLFFLEDIGLSKECTEAEAEAHKQVFLEMIAKKQIVYQNPTTFHQVLDRIGKTNVLKKGVKGEFQSMNEINEIMVAKHRDLCLYGYLGSVHTKLPYQQLISIGGFEVLYPVFEKSVKSNLPEFDKATIWKYLFRILKIMMNVEVTHVLSLFSSGNLIDILRMCLEQAIRKQIMTKDLLREVFEVIKDIQLNRNACLLKDFYIAYLNEILINFHFCMCTYSDLEKRKEILILNSLLDFLSSTIHEVKVAPNPREQKVENPLLKECIISLETYEQLFTLLQRVSSIENMSVVKKIGKLLVEFIFKLENKEGLLKIVGLVQKSYTSFSKVYQWILLKIVFKVCILNVKYPSKMVTEVISTFNCGFIHQHLIQFRHSHQSEGEDEICDKIIVQTLKLILYCFRLKRLQQGQRSFVGSAQKQQAFEKLQEEEKLKLYMRISQQLSQNVKILSKTYIALIYLTFKVFGEDYTNKVKMTPDNLIIHVQRRYDTVDLLSDQFDRFMFRITLSCVELFGKETKYLFFNQFNAMIDKKINQIVELLLQDEETIYTKDSLPQIRAHFYQILEQANKQDDKTIIEYFEHIASNLAISQFLYCFDKENNPHLVEVDKKGLLMVNRLLIMYDQSIDAQMKIIKRLLVKVFQYILEQGKEQCLNARVKLNLKLMMLLQFFEELYIRKNGQIIHHDLFLSILGTFLLIFETIGMLSFDYPYRQIFDNFDKENYNSIDFFHLDSQKQQDLFFIDGGPLRIFIYLLLQCLSQYQNDLSQQETILELLRFFVLNEDSPFLNSIATEYYLQNKYQSRYTLCILQQPLKLIKYKTVEINESIYEQMKQHIQVKSQFKQSLVQTPAFLTLLLMGELYELINNAQLSKSFSEDKKKILVVNYLQLMYDICGTTFTEPMGTNQGNEEELCDMFFAITDASVKRDLFVNFDCIYKSPSNSITPIFLCTSVERTQKQIRETSVMDLVQYNDRAAQDYNVCLNPCNKAVRASYFSSNKCDLNSYKINNQFIVPSNLPTSLPSALPQKRVSSDQLPVFKKHQDLDSKEEESKSDRKITDFRDMITLNESIQIQLSELLKDLFKKLIEFLKDPEEKEGRYEELMEAMKSEMSVKFFNTLPIVSSTRFIDIIEYINQHIEWKTMKIRKEMDFLKSSKSQIDGLTPRAHYQQNVMVKYENTDFSELAAVKKIWRRRESSQETCPVESRLHSTMNLDKNSHLKSNTLHGIYIKKQYKGIIRRLETDERSLWYDHLEQMKKDFADLKEVYKQVNIVKKKLEGEDFLQQKNEYSYFIRQRRVFDMWGRMMLVKPNRKYSQNKFWQTQAYFFHDFLKTVFSLSFMDDSDFKDFVPATNFHSEINGYPAKGQSRMLKGIKNMLLRKIESNELLYRIFTCPEMVMDPNRHEQFNEYIVEFGNEPYFSCLSQLVTVEGTYTGHVYLTKDYLMFQASSTPIDMCKYPFALSMPQDVSEGKLLKIWRLAEIEEAFRRRFLLVHQAVELFTFKKKSYFLNLLEEDRCNEFLSKLEQLKNESKSKMVIVKNPKQRFEQLKFKKMWEDGDMPNQQFLMLINKYSGRSFNDMRQYPIFPWIINDYKIDNKTFAEKFGKEEIFRDLQKNTATLSPEKKFVANKIYQQNREEDFQYGTEKFYIKFGCSNFLTCLRLLNRVEPFTSMHIKANTHLDEPDRTFKSIRREWKNILKEKQVNEELTPEFFYFPEIFKNHNLNHYGLSSKGLSVNDVKLANWCKNEHDFVRMQREVLESTMVRSKLKTWVDLLFGAKQHDKSRKNIYFSFAYEKNWQNLAAKKELEDYKLLQAISSVREFMQVPQQLFHIPLDKEKKGPHSQSEEEKEDLEEEEYQMLEVSPPPHNNKNTPKAFPLVGKLLDQGENEFQGSIINHLVQAKNMQQLSLGKIIEYHLIKDKDIIYMMFTQNAKCLVFEKQAGGMIGVHSCRETICKEDLKNKMDINLRADYIRGCYSNCFAEYYDKSTKIQCLYVGQNLDNSIKIYDLNRKKQMNLIYSECSHKNIVTAIRFSKDYHYFISGDADGEIRVYLGANSQHMQCQSFCQHPPSKDFPFILKSILQDQMAAILYIDINLVLDMFVTASSDGTIALRCLRTCRLFKLIHNTKLQLKSMHVNSLKLSLHGYIVLVLKLKEFCSLFMIYSLNGELLCYQLMERLEIKKVFLTKKENNILVAQNVRKPNNQVMGQLKVYKLYNLSKIQDVEMKFYGYVQGQNNTGQALPPFMPQIKNMAISRSERTMTVYLENGEMFCFDMNIIKVKNKLQDFGF